MIRFYYSLAPNPMKVALFLEEAGLPYESIPIDTRKGEQFAPEFARLNPNNKVPVIVDGDAVVFDSNAILLYLAEKSGQFLPASDAKSRGEMFSWLMFVASGVGPYSGQAVHFRTAAPEPKDYAVQRYLFEANRHYGILEARLAERRFMLGDSYTLVDIALWGWARMVPYVTGNDAAWQKFPNFKRWFDEINARPAVARANAIKERHAFKTELDEDARRFMFRHTHEKV